MTNLTVSEYAKQIGAELKPTCLADMPVLNVSQASGSSFDGYGTVEKWLTVKSPDGGLNRTGTWPFSVARDFGGKLIISASSY